MVHDLRLALDHIGVYRLHGHSEIILILFCLHLVSQIFLVLFILLPLVHLGKFTLHFELASIFLDDGPPEVVMGFISYGSQVTTDSLAVIAEAI